MRKRQWHCQRHAIPTRDAPRRWDQVYQYLVLWSQSSVGGSSESHTPLRQEEDDASRHVCSGLHATSGAGANH